MCTGCLKCRGSPEEVIGGYCALRQCWPGLRCEWSVLAAVEADSEPDTLAQDVYWGVLLGMIGAREHKELD